MGYNTSVIVINDALSSIERDPDFGRKLAAAVSAASLPEEHFRFKRDVSALGHVNAATMIETHHADMTSVVTFGGNMGWKQLTTWGWLHHELPRQEDLCRQWADKLGFRLVKKTVNS